MNWITRVLFGTAGGAREATRSPGRKMAHPVVPLGFELSAGTAFDRDSGMLCVGCGAPLGFDPEDEPDGEGPGQHLCGECSRARNFDAELESRTFFDP